jgi:ribonucleoside-diphosphate reductase alpha chain
MRKTLILNEGSVQNVDRLPDDLKEIYRTAWETPMKSLIEMASDRGAFIDQSQSLNLFMESPTIGKLSSMYMYAWKQGIKTTYYLRSRPATRINQTTVGASPDTPPEEKVKSFTDAEALACSLENPEHCEACD